jgi:hypothetical protein
LGEGRAPVGRQLGAGLAEQSGQVSRSAALLGQAIEHAAGVVLADHLVVVPAGDVRQINIRDQLVLAARKVELAAGQLLDLPDQAASLDGRARCLGGAIALA